jgi:hypothetical protein
MHDPYISFLENTSRAAQDLAARSSVMRVLPVGAPPPAAYRLVFSIRYLRLMADGVVGIAPGPVVSSVYFPPDYLHSGDPSLALRVISVDTPGFLHPNVRQAVCLGSAFQPATPFRSVVTALYSILTYSTFNTDERNALSPVACRLLREHRHLLEELHAPPLFDRSGKEAAR